jgi:hypothetical protein
VQDDEFERSPLPSPVVRRSPSPRRDHRRSQPRRLWRFPAIPVALVIILALLFSVKGSAVVAESLPPIAVAAGPWQRIPLPAQNGKAVHTIAASRSDPNTLYACVGPILGSSYPAAIGPTWVFRTRDAGAHWQQLPLPLLKANWCSVTAEGGAPERLIVELSDYTVLATEPACAGTATYISDDGGDSWQTLPRAPIGPTNSIFVYCSFWQTAHSSFALIAYGHKLENGARQYMMLERSDDGGRTWQRIDAALPSDIFAIRFLLGGPEQPDDTMVVAALRFSGTAAGQSQDGYEIWRTDDAGDTWRRLSAIPYPVSAGAVNGPERQPQYMVLGDQPPAELFPIEILQLSPDDRRWSFVPPLPVPSSAPDRSGLLQVIGTTPDGRVFALGVDPRHGVPAQPSPFSSTNPSYQAFAQALSVQWVWIWDPRILRWEVAPAPLHVAPIYGYGCGNCWEAQAIRGSGFDTRGRQAGGTYVWVRDPRSTESLMYRLFVPDATA